MKLMHLGQSSRTSTPAARGIFMRHSWDSFLDNLATAPLGVRRDLGALFLHVTTVVQHAPSVDGA